MELPRPGKLALAMHDLLDPLEGGAGAVEIAERLETLQQLSADHLGIFLDQAKKVSRPYLEFPSELLPDRKSVV